MALDENQSDSVVYDSGAEGPLALPWREASRYFISLPSQPLHVKGARVTLTWPKHVRRLVIDGPSVCCSGGGKRLLLKTEDLLGAKVKGEGVYDGKQHTSVVLCYQATSTPRDDNEAEALLPASYGELLLYVLPKKPIFEQAWSLALQELVVHQINSHIESIRGVGGVCNTVSVENDTYVDSTGFSSLVNRAVDDQGGDEGQEQQTTSRADMNFQAEGSDTQLHNTLVVSRAWQQTPVLPLATSRLSFETQGNELVVSCRPPSAVYRWAFAFWFACLVWKNLFSYRTTPNTFPGREDPDRHHWYCQFWVRSIFDLCMVALCLLWGTGDILERVYKKPTLRVSPAGWSLSLRPEQVTSSFFLTRFFPVTRKELSSSTVVHGAKVLANVYPRRMCLRRASISAVLHTAAGTFPLDLLLGRNIDSLESSFMQQDYETLVATINRHLSAVCGAPVATQNEIHPSVFTEISTRGKFHCITVEEHDEMLTQQRDAVRAMNFNRCGRWVSTESLDASTARSAIATVANMHASLGGTFPDPMRHPNKATSQIQFICTDFPTYIVCFLLWEVIPFLGGLSFLSTFAYLALFAVQTSNISCMYSIVWQCMINLFMFSSYGFIFATVAHMRRVVAVQVSPSGRFWKLQRSFGSPPFSMFGFWNRSCIPLKQYVTWWTCTVAEGSTDDLRGCEVRIKQVNTWFTKDTTQRASLFLHHHPSGAAQPKELRLAGWDTFQLTNISEKLIIAQAINSALATEDNGIDIAANC